MNTVLLEPHYLPSLEYFCAILPFNRIILERHEHYVKQSDRNRCFIQTVQGPTRLVVPLTGKHSKVAFKEIRLDESKKWQNNHWRTIQSAYAKAPFFEHYESELKKVIYLDTEFLFVLNQAGLSFCLRNLGLHTELSGTEAYEKEAGTGIFDLRGLISSKKPYSSRPYYQASPYHQVFGNTFVSNLSLIDLLFCEGPNALAVLKASTKVN